MDLKSCNKDDILSEELFSEIFDEEDAIARARMIIACEDRAKELGVKQKFNSLVKTYERTLKQIESSNKKQKALVDGITNFTFPEKSTLRNMACGSWIAGEDGIFLPSFNSYNDITACYHPILPIERIRNIETGEEQIVLAYKRNHVWNEIKVQKNRIASSSKIVDALSGQGVLVNSENAKYLVKYLSDVEFLNEDVIDIQQSTSKLGWLNGEFVPYNSEVVFDGEFKHKDLFESIVEYGDYELWKNHVRQIRSTGRIEPKFMLSASFASVLVKFLGTLPFIVDLWGETEEGKTVCLMLGASVWANPDNNQYIGDFKTTDVALEVKADALNNLPLIIDDSSKVSAKLKDRFEGLVYDLASGSGKARSNRELGTAKEKTWKLCVLTNGEQPLNSYCQQGGALNRILEVECGSTRIFENGQETVEILKNNYGFAGRDFINALTLLGYDRVKEIYDGFCQELFNSKNMMKQAISLAVLLTADKIATELIFADGKYISIEDAKKALLQREMVSDNERGYKFILDKIGMNRYRFDGTNNCEQWGIIEEVSGQTYAVLYPQAMEQICNDGGFSKESFLSWAIKRGFILLDKKGNKSKLKKIDGVVRRCYYILISDNKDEDDSEADFIEVVPDENPFVQETLI